MLEIWSLVPLVQLVNLEFSVHILLKPSLKDFEHNFASMWNESNCKVVTLQRSLALPFFGIGMKTDLFQSCVHWWVFQIRWHIECSTFTASSFRIWNSSPGIPSPPLALFWEFPAWLRELKLGALWQCREMEWGGREVQEGGDTYTPMADSRWCMGETNKIL